MADGQWQMGTVSRSTNKVISLGLASQCVWACLAILAHEHSIITCFVASYTDIPTITGVTSQPSGIRLFHVHCHIRQDAQISHQGIPESGTKELTEVVQVSPELCHKATHEQRLKRGAETPSPLR